MEPANKTTLPFMKCIPIITLWAVILLPSLLMADESAKPLPKFEKMLPSEHFFNKEPISVGHTYGFATNKNLKEIRKLLLKSLGEGWEFKVIPPEELAEMSKNGGIHFEGVGNLVHEDYARYSIGVTLIGMPETQKKELKDYQKMLSIVTVDLEIAMKLESKKKESEGAENSAPDKESKPKLK